MKKIISVLLSFVILASVTAGMPIISLAADQYYEVESNDSYNEADWIRVYSSIIGECGYNDYDYFKIKYTKDMPLEIKFSHDYSSYGAWRIWVEVFDEPGHFNRYQYDIYADDNLTTVVLSEKLPTYGEVVVRVSSRDYYGYPEDVDYKIDVYEKINKPSNVKTATRNTTSLKLSWGKVSGATGYQLQRKTSTGYTGVATTTANYATATGLKPGYAYEFRVRAYRKVNGKYYYSSWRTFKDATRPNGVSLSGLTAYSSGHKIKASWKKVSGYATGYQVMWAKDSSFRNVVGSNYINGQGNVSYTRANFSKGRNYYVRVRAYRTMNGTKYYGAWSNVRYVKAK